MTIQPQNLSSPTSAPQIHFDLRRFVREHILRSWLLAVWLVALTYVTAVYTWGQLQTAALVTAVVILLWAITLSLTVYNELRHKHNTLTLWLKANLYSSITNVLLSLLLTLLILAGIRAFFDYAFVRANFSSDLVVVAQWQAQLEAAGVETGANWGAVVDNMRNMLVFRYPREETWRIYAALAYLGALLLVSLVVYSRERFRHTPIRRITTILWLLAPILTFSLLLGVAVEPELVAETLIESVITLVVFGGLFFFTKWVTKRFPVTGIGLLMGLVWVAMIAGTLYVMVGNFTVRLNPDQSWGGLLLTMIIAVFAIVASFPLGVMLALGRRSQIRGVPAWLTYGTAVLLTVYFLITSTLDGLRDPVNFFAILLALWPLLIPLVAYLFQKYFKGNVVAAFCTLYIEMIRGVPLITVLFMSIILFPILLPQGMEILSTWRVMAAAALFAAAYLAENVRGGLQAIPKGQYEAADSIGLNTFQKYRLIILPQAIRVVIPAIVGQFIGLFKDTTLIAIVGLVEFLGVANLISAQTDWLGVRREPYIFLMLIYFAGSWVMAASSRRMERQLGVGQR
ncbi:MAG: amino acid ABC transporter permease [Chloroflexota bacterium]